MSIETHGADPLTVRANKLDLLERLADDLAHEIKNPLHSMVINLEVLKRRIARAGIGESDDVMRYIRVLGGELERVNSRVELLLGLSRPARGSEPTTLHELVEELMELIELEAGHKGVALEYEPSGRAARVDLPRDSVRQVVLNLVLDALDGLGSGGALHLRIDRDDGHARVVVRTTPGPNGVSALPAASTGADSRLLVASALGAALGGRVDVLQNGHDAPGDNPGEGVSLVFSLPIARA